MIKAKKDAWCNFERPIDILFDDVIFIGIWN